MSPATTGPRRPDRRSAGPGHAGSGRTRRPGLLAGLAVALLVPLLLAPAGAARAEGRLLEVDTTPRVLQFEGIGPGDRVEFLATVQAVGSGPITLHATARPVGSSPLFDPVRGGASIEVASCPGGWTAEPTARAPQVGCDRPVVEVLAARPVGPSGTVDIPMAGLGQGEARTVRIAITFASSLDVPPATVGQIDFQVTATAGIGPGPGPAPGPGPGPKPGPLPLTGGILDPRLPAALVGAGLLALVLRRRWRRARTG